MSDWYKKKIKLTTKSGKVYKALCTDHDSKIITLEDSTGRRIEIENKEIKEIHEIR